MNLGWRAIDFVGQKEISKDRAAFDGKFTGARVVNLGADHVSGKEVRGKLNAFERQMQRSGECANGKGFGESGRALQQDMPAGEQADQQAVDEISLADEDASDLIVKRDKGLTCIVGGHGVLPHSRAGCVNAPIRRGTLVSVGSYTTFMNNELPTYDAPPVDHARIEAAVREILLAVGEDPDRDGLKETPSRVARMYAEIFSGMRTDAAAVLRKTFVQKYDEVVLVRDIRFSSTCEHHLLPFFGKAHIAYLPNGKIVGLSKLARVVEAVSRRPQVQERITEQVADLIVEELRPRGAAVILEATHTCMTIRGVRKPESLCTTSAMRGCFRDNPTSRAEVMSLIYGGG